MITLLAVMMFEVSPNICIEVEKELIEYNQVTKTLRQEDIDKIVGRCNASWGVGGSMQSS